MLRRNTTAALSLIAGLCSTQALAQDILVKQRTGLTDAWNSANLGTNPAGGVYFGQLTSYNDAEPVSANMKVNTLNKVRIRAQRADNGSATGEDAKIVSFVGDPSSLGLTGETGTLDVQVGSREQRFEIEFEAAYDNPVLFLQPVVDGEPISAQPVFVESGGALVSLAEPSAYDGLRTNTITLNWAVFEAGNYELTDGRAVIVGAIDSATSSYDMANGTTITPYLEMSQGNMEHFASSAAILAQAQRSQGNVWQTVRVQPATATETVLTAFDPTTGEFTFEDVEVLDSVTVRHSRESAVEGADDPDATVGPIGYMIIGDLSGSYDLVAGAAAYDRYDVADDASSFDVALPDSVFKALGGDPDTESTFNAYTSTRDGLSIVRISALALLSAETGYYVDETDMQLNADAAFDDAMTFVRVLFSDGTSALYGGGSGMRMEASDGALEWDSGSIDRAARFGMTAHDDGTYSLHSYFGHYVSVAADGSLSAAATEIGTSQKFYIVDLGELAMSPTPSLRLVEQDMDGDDDPEMVLVAEQDDGTGYFLLDPLGIADTLYKAGYEPDDAFITSLSATQQAGLLEQLDGIDGIDSIEDIDGETLKSVLDSMDENDLERSYSAYEFEYVLEGSLYETGTTSDDGLFGATVTLGEYSAMVDNDEFGVGYRLSATLFSVSGTIGGVLTVTLSVGTVYAAWDVDSNGFAFGGGAELVSVTVMVGDEEGSYASVSAGVGTGWYIAGSWGQNDQYGATIDLPIIPVAVSIYVKGEDVENVANAIADWTIEAYDDAAAFASNAWNAAGDWAEGAGNSVLAGVSDEYNVARATVSTFASQAIIFAQDEAGDFVNTIEDIGSGLSSALNEVGSAFASVGSTFGQAIDAIDDFFSFSWI